MGYDDREVGDPQATAITLSNLGYATRKLGDPERARMLYDECLTIQREIGDQWGEANTENNLGFLASDLGEVPAAEGHFHRALRLAVEIETYPIAFTALVDLSQLLAARGERTRAAKAFHAVATHPALDPEMRKQVLAQIAQVEEGLTPEEAKRARRGGESRRLEELCHTLTGGSPP